MTVFTLEEIRTSNLFTQKEILEVDSNVTPEKLINSGYTIREITDIFSYNELEQSLTNDEGNLFMFLLWAIEEDFIKKDTIIEDILTKYNTQNINIKTVMEKLIWNHPIINQQLWQTAIDNNVITLTDGHNWAEPPRTLLDWYKDREKGPWACRCKLNPSVPPVTNPGHGEARGYLPQLTWRRSCTSWTYYQMTGTSQNHCYPNDITECSKILDLPIRNLDGSTIQYTDKGINLWSNDVGTPSISYPPVELGHHHPHTGLFDICYTRYPDTYVSWNDPNYRFLHAHPDVTTDEISANLWIKSFKIGFSCGNAFIDIIPINNGYGDSYSKGIFSDKPMIWGDSEPIAHPSEESFVPDSRLEHAFNYSKYGILMQYHSTCPGGGFGGCPPSPPQSYPINIMFKLINNTNTSGKVGVKLTKSGWSCPLNGYVIEAYYKNSGEQTWTKQNISLQGSLKEGQYIELDYGSP